MPKRIDIAGQKFGEWTVLSYDKNMYWNCRCSCGKEKRVNGNMLRHGKSLSCGHTSEKAFKDLTDSTFGEWRVLKYTGDGLWRCKCSCGKEKDVHSYTLRSGKSTSCGHSTTGFKDLTNIKFGEWTALKYVGDQKWLCKCSCSEDKLVEVLTNSLLTGKSKSCGHDSNEFKDLTGEIFGELEANRFLGGGMWECQCSCGKMINVHTYALRSGNTKSCGHIKSELMRKTKLDKYGELSTSKMDKPREKWQIQVVESEGTLKQYLTNFDIKPTYTELSQQLGIEYSTISQKVRRYGLEDYINISESKSEQEKELSRLVENIAKCEIKTSVRNIISPYELDIYIPSKKLAIEFNGTYWHSSLMKDRRYHQKKTIACAKKGIQLIHVFEYEWLDSIKKEKIISMLNKVLNTQVTTKVYGRNTKVALLNNREAIEFCNKYHLQGGINSEINIGIYYADVLIGVMTFGKPRFSRENQWEILRICFKDSIKVLGGTKKMFKYFLKVYNPESIVSYCDISKFKGEVYTGIGFKLDKLTEPNYVWANSYGNTLTRYQTQKHKLLENELGTEADTENNIMSRLGYYKVYDSGNLRFTWSRQ